jgi:hypothetical protein
VSDKTVVAAMIAAIAALFAAGFGLYQGINVANIAARQKTWEVELQRRNERLETYQKAIDLLTDFGWRYGDKDYDVKRDFNVPFVRAANRVRVHGSPATVAAMDEIQSGFGRLNDSKTERDRNASLNAIQTGLDHLVDAAREDVGPKLEDGLRDVKYSKGAGPRT